MNTDARVLDRATLTELRKRSVAAVQSGEAPRLVSAALGANLRTLFRCSTISTRRVVSVGRAQARRAIAQARWSPAPKLSGKDQRAPTTRHPSP